MSDIDPPPLRAELREPLDDEAVERVWRRVAARRRRSVGARGFALAAAAVTVVALGGIIGKIRRDRAEHARVVHASGGALRAAGGGLFRAYGATAERGFVALSDGSRIEIDAGGALDAIENNGRVFVVRIASGRVTFDVRPHGPRRWTIECGLAIVEVVGTRFVVERTAARVRVDVQHGIVRVRGERVSGGDVWLTAGRAITVESRESTSAPRELVQTTEAPRNGGRAAEHDGGGARSASAATSASPAAAVDDAGIDWRPLADRGAFGDAYAVLGATGIAREAQRADPDALIDLADVARRSGHPDDALVPLRRLLTDFPNASGAATAAYTLGRLELESLGQPAAAASDLALALRLGLPRGLVEETMAWLVEARARGGDHDGAFAGAEAYVARYPHGRFGATVRRWAGIDTHTRP